MTARKILVAFGSKRGSTAGIADEIATVLRDAGFEVEVARASAVPDVTRYDGVVIGGALYMNRWYSEARRFVRKHRRALRERPVWMFSSGPLDYSAAGKQPVRGVLSLMDLIGARGHVTFGGRLATDATGFPAAAMAKTRAGDWRAWDEIRGWAGSIATAMSMRDLHRPSVARPTGNALAALCLAIGVAAIVGGLGLVSWPDGSAMRLPIEVLEHTPFTGFTIPGLVLLLAIGGTATLAGTLLLRESSHADGTVFIAGSVLLGWIVIQMVLLRSANLLQITMLIAAFAMIGGALRRHATRATA